MIDQTREQAEALWRAYQIGRVSLDHTNKAVFIEVVSPVLAKLTALREAAGRAMNHHNKAECICVNCADLRALLSPPASTAPR